MITWRGPRESRFSAHWGTWDGASTSPGCPHKALASTSLGVSQASCSISLGGSSQGHFQLQQDDAGGIDQAFEFGQVHGQQLAIGAGDNGDAVLAGGIGEYER